MKIIKALALAAILLPAAAHADQQEYTAPASGAQPSLFTIESPDYKASPMTGMTRQHWIHAGEYLLDGAFSYIHTLDDPMYFPKQLDKTYPRDNGGIRVAKLEGLCRTMFVAAPLLRENPDLTLRGIRVQDYFLHQIKGLTIEGSTSFTPCCPNGPGQTLLELGAMCISLKAAQPVLWDPLTPEEKDRLALMLKSYGEGPTIDSNWRFFNVFILAFLKDQGYDVNMQYYEQQLAKLVERYRGEGWYNDSPAYDYYSMWAYQTYGPLWAEFFGQQFPEYAETFRQYQSELIDNYPYMFARDGQMNMWGRSIPYRFGATAPLAMLGLNHRDDVNFGWMRMISSSTLLQFLQSPDFLSDGVPTMGYYGEFAPAVQIYSCRGSVYWCGKAFFNLLLPADHPYWTAKENDGPWSKFKKSRVYNKFQPATNLLITDYPDCGGAEMRSWCHEKVADDWQKFRSSENYNKLAYHTEFPWMADAPDGVVSMNYATLNAQGQWEVLRLYDFVSFENGIYSRVATLENEPEVRYQLNDIPLANGVLRIDRVTAPGKRKIHLGSYSLPEYRPQISSVARPVNVCSLPARIIDNGEYQLATVPVYGWDATRVAVAEGVHPVSDRCAVMLNEAEASDQIFVTLQLWQPSGQPMADALLNLVKAVSVNGTAVTVTLADGKAYTVNF